MTMLLDVAQYETAAMAIENTPNVMESLSGASFEPEYEATPDQWVGVNGDGYNTLNIMAETIVEGKRQIKLGFPVDVALHRIEIGMLTRARTILTDTQWSASMLTAKGRYAYARPVRVLNPPSCGRCVILAGTDNTSLRHPNCDCTMAWSNDMPKDAYADPISYLDDLRDEGREGELRRVLGSRANVRAYIDGADVSQLVNAYRRKGSVMSMTPLYARNIKYRRIKYTLEGTTKRGSASYRMIKAGYAKKYIKNGGKYTRVDRPRLMPETIYQVAEQTGKNPKDLLKAYGWIL